jgi:integrase
VATIEKRGARWRAAVCVRRVRRSKSFRTKAEAATWALEQEALLAKGTGLAPPGATVRTLLEKYAREVSEHKRGKREESLRISRILRDDALANVALGLLGSADIAGWRDRRLKAVSAASVRREWTLLSHACTVAVRDWQWLPANPCKVARRPPPPPDRERVMSADEVERICFALGYDGGEPRTVSQRVAVALLLALETALRASELTGLTWERVDLERRVARLSAATKAGVGRDVPLSTEAVRLLTLLGPAEVGSVFGLQSRQVDALFRKARDRAGIADLHWHDSRHTAITRLAQRLHVLDLARMVGHRDLRQLQTYYNPAAEDLAAKLD